MDLFTAATQACECGSDLNIPRALALFGLAVWFAGSVYWWAVCWWVAKEKDRNVTAWAALGFFLWIGAYLPLAAAPDLTEYETD